MTERIPVIVGAARTPTGKFLGGLASFTAPQLGAIVIREAVRRAGIDPAAIDEVIMGNVVSAGVNEFVIPNYKQTWGNIRKIADAPASV